MLVRCDISLDDHLAWYDYYSSTVAKPWWSSLPLVGALLSNYRRRRFSQAILSPGNDCALGERSIELSPSGIRESSPKFDFSTAWEDLAFAALSPEHLFFAHPSMNAHIVPLRSFGGDALRDSFVLFALSHAPSSPTVVKSPITRPAKRGMPGGGPTA